MVASANLDLKQWLLAAGYDGAGVAGVRGEEPPRERGAEDTPLHGLVRGGIVSAAQEGERVQVLRGKDGVMDTYALRVVGPGCEPLLDGDLLLLKPGAHIERIELVHAQVGKREVVAWASPDGKGGYELEGLGALPATERKKAGRILGVVVERTSSADTLRNYAR
jgi:hypothetical protein